MLLPLLLRLLLPLLLLLDAAVSEMSSCFADARDDPDIGVIVLTGAKRGGGAPTPASLTPPQGRQGQLASVGVSWDQLGLVGAFRPLLDPHAHPSCQLFALFRHAGM